MVWVPSGLGQGGSLLYPGKARIEVRGTARPIPDIQSQAPCCAVCPGVSLFAPRTCLFDLCGDRKHRGEWAGEGTSLGKSLGGWEPESAKGGHHHPL